MSQSETRQETPSRRHILFAGAAMAASASLLRAADAKEESMSHETALTRKQVTTIKPNPKWPALTRYSGDYLNRIAFPVGGLGTGCIGLGGRGELRDWELVNLPAWGYQPINTHFALWTKDSTGKTVTRCLEGVVPNHLVEGWNGAEIRNSTLPRFRKCDFLAAYPFAQVLLEDPSVPLRVRLEAFNPFVPADAEASGHPVAVLRYVLINPTDAPIEASVCGTVENFIGWDGHKGKPDKNVNEFKSGGALKGIAMRSDGIAKDANEFGTVALAVMDQANVSHKLDWADLSWGDSLLDFWTDLSTDGKLEPQAQSGRPAPFASLAPRVTVPARGETAITFLIGWHFPNRKAWTPPHPTVGNYYATQYKDAWDAVAKFAPKLADLEAKSLLFTQSVLETDLPDVLKDACLSNASTLKTQVVFRTEDGRFFGWEGAGPFHGSCHGSCMHVWNYENTMPFMFGELAKQQRETDFKFACDERGLMSFRIDLPLDKAHGWNSAAADGQMGTIIRLYREWRLSGDDAFIRAQYPHAKRALQFAWIEGGWDADRDGVMEGCQHNTMDIEYYGPNPEVGVLYLGALRAMQEMAKHVGDPAFASECGEIFAKGSAWLDANLFNGDYYEQKIIPTDPSKVAKGLAISGDRDKALDPVLQVGKGCMSDQLLGQTLAHVCSLGYLLKKENVQKTLKSIIDFNFREEFYDHFNHLRTYAANDDKGLIICTYPRGGALKRPFPYAYEVWSGIEWTAAAGMIYEGRTDDALRIAHAVRERHDGLRRNPFSEEECGRHYARAMASWGCLLAWTGFSYDGVEQKLSIKARPGKTFFSNGYAWGTIDQQGEKVTVNVLHGELKLKALKIGDRELAIGEKTVRGGESLSA